MDLLELQAWQDRMVSRVLGVPTDQPVSAVLQVNQDLRALQDPRVSTESKE